MDKNEFDEEALNRWEKLAKEAADEFDRLALLEEVAEDTEEPCRCGAPGEELHTCPFREDINGDSETLCNCCSDCQYQCAMDV